MAERDSRRFIDLGVVVENRLLNSRTLPRYGRFGLCVRDASELIGHPLIQAGEPLLSPTERDLAASFNLHSVCHPRA